jgi:hypothetical protein
VHGLDVARLAGAVGESLADLGDRRVESLLLDRGVLPHPVEQLLLW